jgi:hypothetical protein
VVGKRVKRLLLLAALGVALSSCATVKKTEPQAAAIAPPPAVAAPSPTLKIATPGPWRVTKTEWTKADEDGFGEFVRMIAASGCTTTIACMQSAANFYHDSDAPSFQFHADCAKWAYMLRAYYASKNGLPFSYVSKIYGVGQDGDLRFSPTSNAVLERHDVTDTGLGIDTVSVLKQLHDDVYSATYRMDPATQSPLQQDFYSPKIAPGSVRAGTAIYDINGHVMLVYDVTPDGSVLYMDANPDESVSRGAYGPQVPRTVEALGGGFKNFRPQKLEGALLQPDGTYLGGTMVLASNDAIADYSLDQYRGNMADASDTSPQFRYNNVPLDYYQYVRVAMSNGGFAFNPVYELTVTMASLCQDASDGTKEADARVKSGFATLYADLSNDAALWKAHDMRVLYRGDLRQALWDTYTAQEQACVIADSGRNNKRPLDRFVRRSPETDILRLIAKIEEPAPIDNMQPVGR